MNLRRTLKKGIALATTSRRVGIGKLAAFHTKPANTIVPIEVKGLKILVRAGTSDMKVAMDSLCKEYDFLEDLLPRDFSGLVVDAGGYIGTAAIAFASRFPKATVVTIEPSSDNLSILKRNVAAFENIEVRHAALGPRAGETITLRNRNTGNWGFTVVGGDQSEEVEKESAIEEIRLTSLAEIEQQHGRPIDFLKLDIEGAEKAVLEDTRETVRNIPMVFAELHDRIIAGCSEAFGQMSHGRWVVRLGGEKFLSLQRSK